MKPLSLFLLTSLLCLGSTQAATVITETYSKAVSSLIPDADVNGVLQTIDVSGSSLISMDQIVVAITTTGGWNGDFYAYLWHDGVLTVLLNRPGRTLSQSGGSGTSGMTLTLADTALTDVHTAAGALIGAFQPDGRFIDPSLSLDTTPRTDLLAPPPTVPGACSSPMSLAATRPPW